MPCINVGPAIHIQGNTFDYKPATDAPDVVEAWVRVSFVTRPVYWQNPSVRTCSHICTTQELDMVEFSSPEFLCYENDPR